MNQFLSDSFSGSNNERMKIHIYNQSSQFLALDNPWQPWPQEGKHVHWLGLSNGHSEPEGFPEGQGLPKHGIPGLTPFLLPGNYDKPGFSKPKTYCYVLGLGPAIEATTLQLAVMGGRGAHKASLLPEERLSGVAGAGMSFSSLMSSLIS